MYENADMIRVGTIGGVENLGQALQRFDTELLDWVPFWLTDVLFVDRRKYLALRVAAADQCSNWDLYHVPIVHRRFDLPF